MKLEPVEILTIAEAEALRLSLIRRYPAETNFIKFLALEGAPRFRYLGSNEFPTYESLPL